MLTFLIIENVLLLILGYFIMTIYGINRANMKDAVGLVSDLIGECCGEWWDEWKIDRMKYLRTYYKTVVRYFK